MKLVKYIYYKFFTPKYYTTSELMDRYIKDNKEELILELKKKYPFHLMFPNGSVVKLEDVTLENNPNDSLNKKA